MKTFLTDNWIRCWKAHQLSYLLHCVAFNVSLLPHHRHNITVTTQHNIIHLSIPIANDDMSALLIGINSTKRNVIWRRKKFFQRWNSLPRSLLLSNEGKLNTAIRILSFENDIRIRYDILPQWMRPSIYFSQLFPIYMYFKLFIFPVLLKRMLYKSSFSTLLLFSLCHFAISEYWILKLFAFVLNLDVWSFE